MAPRHLGLVQQARGSTSAGAGGTGGHPCGSSLNKRLAGGAPQTRLHGGPGRAKREPPDSAWSHKLAGPGMGAPLAGGKSAGMRLVSVGL